MEIITVEDMMVPLEEYATVSEEATLFDAVIALEKAQEDIDRTRHQYLHRGILVYDGNKKIVGKISPLDALRSLEPKYDQMGDMRTLSRAGFSPEFMKSMLDTYSLCDKSFTDMCSQGANRQVKDFMYTPTEGEYVQAEDSLCEAIHHFVMGHHQSLLVTRDEEIIGVLRLIDVFKQVFQTMKTCKL